MNPKQLSDHSWLPLGNTLNVGDLSLENMDAMLLLIFTVVSKLYDEHSPCRGLLSNPFHALQILFV